MSLAEANQNGMMVDMAGSLLFKNIGDFQFKLVVALYVMYLFHGISHSFVTDNDTMNSTTTEITSLQTVNRKDPVENFTREVQILTRNESEVGNHSKNFLNSAGLSFNSTQLSVDMEYTKSTSAEIAESLVSTDRENSVTEIPSMTIETGLDKRYDFPLKLVFKTLIVCVQLSF